MKWKTERALQTAPEPFDRHLVAGAFHGSTGLPRHGVDQRVRPFRSQIEPGRWDRRGGLEARVTRELEKRAQRVVHGAQLQRPQGALEARDPATSQLLAERAPGPPLVVRPFHPVEEDVASIRVELEPQSPLSEVRGTMHVLESAASVAERDQMAARGRESEGLAQ